MLSADDILSRRDRVLACLSEDEESTAWTLPAMNASSSLCPTAARGARTLDLDAVFRTAREGVDSVFTSQLNKLQEELQEERALRRAAEAKFEDLRVQVHCCVCLERRRSVAVQPCFHLVCCETCQNKLTSCPICRAKTHGSLRVCLA
mmetsp:Transcript_97411/g.247691  ORF Transcript_97411/g.247691 Transcript_97411/m.247691 type:complete len:148 (-) Transcript_97411:30-473(-)